MPPSASIARELMCLIPILQLDESEIEELLIKGNLRKYLSRRGSDAFYLPNANQTHLNELSRCCQR